MRRPRVCYDYDTVCAVCRSRLMLNLCGKIATAVGAKPTLIKLHILCMFVFTLHYKCILNPVDLSFALFRPPARRSIALSFFGSTSVCPSLSLSKSFLHIVVSYSILFNSIESFNVQSGSPDYT